MTQRFPVRYISKSRRCRSSPSPRAPSTKTAPATSLLHSLTLDGKPATAPHPKQRVNKLCQVRANSSVHGSQRWKRAEESSCFSPEKHCSLCNGDNHAKAIAAIRDPAWGLPLEAAGEGARLLGGLGTLVVVCFRIYANYTILFSL